MENSSFVSDTEWTTYIEQSVGELLDLCIETAGPQNFAVVSGEGTTTSGTDVYDVPDPADPETAASLYKVIAVLVKFDGTYRRVRRMRIQDAQTFVDNDGTWSGRDSVFYQVAFRTDTIWEATTYQRQIRFFPSPPSGRSFKLLYIPFPYRNDTTYINGLPGWEDYVVVDAAAKALEKEESDARALWKRKAELTERIRFHAATLNLDETDQVRDINLDRQDRWWDRY